MSSFMYGHWSSHEEVDEENNFGFVYLISCVVNNRKYVGKKQFYSYRKRKKYKKMPWREYQGSSKDLHKDIKKYGKDKFIFEILFQCSTRGSLAYEEANLQHRLEVLTSELSSGEKEYYNKSIAGIKFSVRSELTEEHKKKISEHSKGMPKNTLGILKEAQSPPGRKRRSELMKELNSNGKAYRSKHKPYVLTFRDGSRLYVEDWPSFCEKEGYPKHGIWNMLKGRQKTMRRNGETSMKDVVKVEKTTHSGARDTALSTIIKQSHRSG